MHTMTDTRYYTVEQLARALGVTRPAIDGRLTRGTITPTTTDADGKPLFSEDYVQQLKSEQDARLGK